MPSLSSRSDNIKPARAGAGRGADVLILHATTNCAPRYLGWQLLHGVCALRRRSRRRTEIPRLDASTLVCLTAAKFCARNARENFPSTARAVQRHAERNSAESARILRSIRESVRFQDTFHPTSSDGRATYGICSNHQPPPSTLASPRSFPSLTQFIEFLKHPRTRRTRATCPSYSPRRSR